ncbi:hypothetical protein [Pedobacter cryophilus]|uniref:Viral A-type inclusion protein n=1 Tax=Pedobacter cryophilus TaxID=2571271 RepID=A0A4U1BXG2_9SPHI|nr:hypothetical protein [Pedobacter cryophilus]TKB97706.1 hypothetical protein FA046_10095 [Pedobacter cryophilus]
MILKISNCFYALVFLLFALSGCQNQKAEQQKLQKEVIDQHDVLMGRMDLLQENKSALSLIENKLDSLKKVKPDLDTVQLKTEMIDLKIKLTNADEAMMKWMNNFNTDYTGKNHDEVMSYLKDQKIKIDSVKTLFDQSLSKSGAIIQKYK